MSTRRPIHPPPASAFVPAGLLALSALATGFWPVALAAVVGLVAAQAVKETWPDWRRFVEGRARRRAAHQGWRAARSGPRIRTEQR